MPRITTPFDAQSTAADVIAGVDLTGKRAVITGGTSGIGRETAHALATAGAQVTLAVRDTARRRTHRRRHQRRHRTRRHPRRPPRPGRPRHHRRLHRRLDRPPAHPRQQRRDHGAARTHHDPRGLGDAVRHQPPRPRRPHPGPARRARRRTGRPRRRGHLLRPPACHRSSSTTSTSPHGPTRPGPPTASPRPRSSCSPSPWPRSGPPTSITANALHPGGVMTNLQRHLDETQLRFVGALDEQGRRMDRPPGLEDPATRRRHLGPAGRLPAPARE